MTRKIDILGHSEHVRGASRRGGQPTQTLVPLVVAVQDPGDKQAAGADEQAGADERSRLRQDKTADVRGDSCPEQNSRQTLDDKGKGSGKRSFPGPEPDEAACRDGAERA